MTNVGKSSSEEYSSLVIRQSSFGRLLALPRPRREGGSMSARGTSILLSITILMRLSNDPPTGRVPLKWIELVGLVAVLGIAVWIYRGAFHGYFVQDDYGWLETSRFQSLGDYFRIFFRFN